MSAAAAIDRLLTRAVTAGVVEPKARPQPFAAALHDLLRRRGVAAYFASSGPGARELLRTVRDTPSDTAVIFLVYGPAWFALAAVLLAAIRWRLDGRFVVICRDRAPVRTFRQRVAYWAVRRAVGLELVGLDDPEAVLATWPPDRLPPRSWLAAGWRARAEPTRVDEILPLLRCPRCRSELERRDQTLVCESAHEFAIEDGIPVLLPETLELDLEKHEEEHPAGDAYDQADSPGWHEVGLYKRDLVARMVRATRPRASIDVGCGDWGLYFSIAGAMGSDIAVAGDVSLDLVRFARNACTAPGRVHYMVFAAEALPFREGVFDLTYCSEVLEHLARPDAALAEMRRTSARGRAILTVPNEKVTGKLEDGHVQTFGYDDFMALVRKDVDVTRTLGTFLWVAERNLDRLHRDPFGRLRMSLYELAGQKLPRWSLNIIVDGTFR